MNYILSKVIILFSAASVVVSTVANAVCLDPNSDRSGYRVSLTKELKEAQVVLIGTVRNIKVLHEDSSDPNDITAYIYTIQVSETLKGLVSKSIELRSENDSGRYWMEVGEKHLLFMELNDSYYSVDSCGNSTKLPDGNITLNMAKEALKENKNVP